MARTSLSALRRLELEKAVYDSVTELGFRGFALEEVARHAGIAKGNIHHYFASKEELMTAFARYANRRFAETFVRLLKTAKSPSERLWTIIALNLSDEFFQPVVLRAYVLALANGLRYQGVLRVYEATHARSLSNLIFVLKSLVEPREVETIAHTLWTMIEGAWLLQAIRFESIAPETLATIASYLKNTVPRFDSSIVSLTARRGPGQ